MNDSLQERLDRLSPAKRQSLLRRLRDRGVDPATVIPVTAAPDRREAPLTPVQRQLWLFEQSNPGLATYHIPCVLRLRGPLDVPRLRAALAAVRRAHPGLRATFTTCAGEPMQRVTSSDDDLLVMLPEEAAVTSFLAAPFELASEPPMRAALVRVASAEHVLALCLHHIAADGASLDVVLEMLRAQYVSPTAVEPGLSSLDHAAWLRELYPDDGNGVAFWSELLTDCWTLPDLPGRGRAGATTAGVEERTLSTSVTAQVRALAARSDTTTFVVMLAAYQAFLYRVCGQRSFSVGTAASLRNRPELANVVAPLLNMIALPARIDPAASFADYVRDTNTRWRRAVAHQHVPFDVVLATRPSDVVGPAFRACLAMNPATSSTSAARHDAALDLGVDWNGVRVTHEDPGLALAKFDLTLEVVDADPLVVALQYAHAAIDPTTARELADAFVVALSRAVDEPTTALGELPLMSPAGRAHALACASGPERAWSFESVSSRVRRAVVAGPDDVAIVRGDEVVTYAALDARADAIAAELARAGVGPGDRVAVRMARSPDWVAVMLACHRRGAAFLSVDPAYPVERQRYLVEDSGATLLVCDVASATGELGCNELCIDGAELVADSRSAVTHPLVDDALAYLVYTSGSTGRPKGVAITHGGLSHLVEVQAERLGWGPGERVLQFASPSFDAAVWEVFGALCAGAALVLPPTAAPLVGDELATVLAAYRVTAATVPPSVLAGVPERALPELRTLIVAGERCPAHVAQRFAPGRRFINAYGPSEATVCSSLGEVLAPDEAACIGTANPDTELYVLDAAMRPCLPGVPGELYIGGRSLARGYVGNPGLTASAFVPNPFGAGRLYRTGDVVVREHDGRLWFRGRRDTQVKLHGVRLELQEIERALGEHPDVRACHVAIERHGSTDSVVAYLVPRPDVALDACAVRACAARVLPRGWVPSRYAVIDRLPTTLHGKLDVARLPTPLPLAGGDANAAATGTERVVAEVWAQALGVDGIAPGDDFFALGGTSLAAVTVARRLAEALEREVPVRLLFEHPVLRDFAGVIDGLAASAARSLPRCPDGAAPLAPAQRRLWFVQAMSPDDSSLNIPLVLDLRGDIDAARLCAAIVQLALRHESLRALVVAGAHGEPVLSYRDGIDVSIRDLSDTATGDAAAAEAAIAAAIGEVVNAPFDLAREASRAVLLRVSASYHVLVWVMHHAVADGWSVGILQRELTALYRGDTLPPLAHRYRDFAHARAHAATSAQLDYWRTALADLPALELAGRPPAAPPYRGGALPVSIPGALAARVRDTARAHAATPFMVLVAAYHVVLSRALGQGDFGIGTVSAGRTVAGTEDLVGPCINTLVLRLRPDRDPTVGDYLRQVRAVCLGAFANEDVPFQDVVEAVRPARAGRLAPMYQVMFGLQNNDRLDAVGCALDAVTVDSRGFSIDRVAVELSLDLLDVGGELRGTLEYAADRFEADDIADLFDRYLYVVEQLVTAPEARLSAIELVRASERPSPAASVDEPWDGSLIERIARTVAARPSAPAVSCRERTWTYAELDARASAVAHRLHAIGVRPGDVVPVLAERELEYVAVLLGLMKIGAVYLPLDPAGPLARARAVCDQVSPRFVIADAHLATDGLASIRIETAALLAPGGCGDVIVARRGPRDLCYVLFTSGSTGAPKGVMLEERGVLNHKLAIIDAFGLCATDVVAQTAAQTFDVSVWQLVTALLVGAQVRIVPTEVAASPRRLWRELRRHATVAQLVPSVIQEVLVDLPDAERDPGTLRLMIATGEALVPAVARQWLERFPAVPLVNAYGPCECSDDVTTHRLESAADVSRDQVPIGAPIRNLTTCVIDPVTLRQCPPNAPGELYVGGIGVGRGYWGRPDQTAASFLPDPHGDEPGARMYRTGDRVVQRRSGELVYLGRADAQIKVRGQRIEPGEVEAALLALESVSQAAVAVVDGRLVAFVVGDGTDLRVRARESLPAGMLPDEYTWLAQLPRLASGKLDRARLPALRRAPAPAPEHVAPASRAEADMMALWERVLGRKVSADAHFFEVGGHSLLAARLVALVEQELGVTLPLREVFESPRLRELAAVVASRRGSGEVRAPIAARRLTRYPLSFAQERFWFQYRLDPDSGTYNVPFAFELVGALDVARLGDSLRCVLDAHAVLRSSFGQDDGDAYQEIRDVARVDLTPHAVASIDEARVAASAFAQAPHVLSSSPIRWRLYRVTADRHVLAVSIHHIAFDGGSSDIFWDDLWAVYRGERTLERGVDYGDIAADQRASGAARVREQLDYWRGVLASAPRLLDLPLDAPRPKHQSFEGAEHVFVVDPATVRRLRRLAVDEDASLFIVTFAALCLLLQRWTGQREVVVGTPTAGRPTAQQQAMIGPFLNTLAIPCRVPGEDAPLRQLVRDVRARVLDAFGHQDVPFEQVVQALGVDRTLDHHPLFQVMFSMQTVAPPTAAAADDGSSVRALPLELDIPSSKFDLTFQVVDDGDALHVSVEYATCLFRAATVDALGTQYGHVLAQLAESPDTALGAVSLVTPDEATRLGELARGPAIECGPLADGLAQSARLHRDRVALVLDGRDVSYSELSERAAQLLRSVRAAGAEASVRLAIPTRKTLDLYAAMFATQQAGHGFVPLADTFDDARIDRTLRDTGCTHRLDADGRVHRLDASAPAPGGAYVLRTSGTTGEPNPVVVSASALGNQAAAARARYELTAADRVLQFASPGFDVALEEVFPTWLAGAAVVAFSDERVSLAAFTARVAEARVTVLNLPASFWHDWAAYACALADGRERLAGIRLLVVGSEPVDRGCVARWRRAFPTVAVRNAYGLTETGITTTVHDLESDDGAGVAVGRPLANGEVVVLDEHLRQVPVGVFGEVYVGGAGLALGYRGRPGLTAARFVPHVAPDRSGERLFRTGDRARWNRDGALEIAGRKDRQLKVRGFRIEPAAIESQLRRADGVHDAVVVQIASGALVACVQPAAGARVDESALLVHVAAHLPAYAVPARIVPVPAFPLGATGKLDRDALTALAATAVRDASARGHAPRPGPEQRLAALWSELLGVEVASRDVTFFELGGNSLALLRLQHRLAEHVGASVPIVSLFEHASLAAMAALLPAGDPASAGVDAAVEVFDV